MQKEQLIHLFQQPSTIDHAETNELRELLEQYPYFQAARAVRLKGLRNSNSLHYNKELKIAAAYTTDRSVLFDFITSEEFNQNNIAEAIKKQETQQKKQLPEAAPEKEEIPDENLRLDKALKMKLRESEQVFDPELFRKPGTEEKAPEEDPLELGKPLKFDRAETHSFTEWLKLASATPVKRDEEENVEKKRKLELIDDFISKNPRIDPSKKPKKVNLAEERLVAPEALMTETLARVYLEQKNYQKAIQAYKILILKNPEKSGFFADQIRAIEKLQDTN